MQEQISCFILELPQFLPLTLNLDLPMYYDNHKLSICPCGFLGQKWRTTFALAEANSFKGEFFNTSTLISHLIEEGGKLSPNSSIKCLKHFGIRVFLENCYNFSLPRETPALTYMPILSLRRMESFHFTQLLMFDIK